MGPWSPNWRPDPTGRRLVAIRIARRGGLLAGLIFTPLVGFAVTLIPGNVSPPLEFDSPGWIAAGVVAVFSAPGIALLGAGLAGSASGSRVDAAVTGVAIAVGVPVAAVTSAMIGAFVAVSFAHGVGDATEVVGHILRAGVTALVQISPLIVLGAILWVALVRRFARVAA
jgi:hypothetical protein